MEVVDPVYVDRSVHTGASQLIIEHANDFTKLIENIDIYNMFVYIIR